MAKSGVTVLMAVYNGEKYLKEAVDSILCQTFSDFEFLIINDGSTDGTSEILKSYEDSRIHIILNESNLGLVKSLNNGLKLAKGEYIARMDADDISLPERLEKQVVFMDKHPEIGVCSAWLQIFGEGKQAIWESPLNHEKICAGLLFHSTIWHAIAMMRKSILARTENCYHEQYVHAEDYELWIRLFLKGVKFANIGEVLYKYRQHEMTVTRIHNNIQKKNTEKVIVMLLNSIGIQPTEDELIYHNMLKYGHFQDKKEIEKVSKWIDKIRAANEKSRIFPEPALSKELAQRWLTLCRSSWHNDSGIWKLFNENSVAEHIDLPLMQKMKISIKRLLRINKKKDLLEFIKKTSRGKR